MTTVTFVTTPDETGKGRIIVDGRHFGLPLETVKLLERLYKEDLEKQNETNP